MKGFNVHRHETNPKERELHNTFLKDFVEPKYSPNTIDRLVFSHPNNSHISNDILNNREKRIALSTIQWLGSPVGQEFLKSCGFELNK